MFLPPYFIFHGVVAFYRTVCVSLQCVIELINYYLSIYSPLGYTASSTPKILCLVMVPTLPNLVALVTSAGAY